MELLSDSVTILKVIGKRTGRSTLFMKLEYIFPECFVLIKQSPQVFPLRCLSDSCPKNNNCMDTLARRVNYIFDNFLDIDLLFLYFSYQNKPGSYKAGLFTRSFDAPRILTLNRSMWSKLKNIGVVYQWQRPNWLSLGL